MPHKRKICRSLTCIALVSWGATIACSGTDSTTEPGEGVVNSAPEVSDVIITDENGGDARPGDLLTGSYSYSDAEGDKEGKTTVQWVKDGEDIEGATSPTYTLTISDVGAEITFEVIPRAAEGEVHGTPVVSEPLSVVAKLPGGNEPTDKMPRGPIDPIDGSDNGAPTVSAVNIVDRNGGAAEVGDELTGSYVFTDAEGDKEAESTFKWYRDGIEIAGATTVNYTLILNDAGTQIVFEVTPVAETGTQSGTAVQSSPLGVVDENNDPPRVSGAQILDVNGGEAVAGDSLTGTYTYLDPEGDPEGDSIYKWYRDGVLIPDESTPRYVLVEADAGKQVKFEVTGVAAAGTPQGNRVSAQIGVKSSVPLDCFVGDVSVTKAAELTFLKPYNCLKGNLRIGNAGGVISDFTQIDLPNLITIQGNLLIVDNPSLSSMTSLANLQRVEDGLAIRNNAVLSNLVGLEKLAYVGELDAGPPNFVGTLFIEKNESLTTISALSNLSYVADSLRIVDNTRLENLRGLEGLSGISGRILIENNSALTSLTGLESFTSAGEEGFYTGGISIYKNAQLKSLHGLQNLRSVVDYVSIRANPLLTDLSALNAVVKIGGDVVIRENNALTSVGSFRELLSVGGGLSLFKNEKLVSVSGFPVLESIGGALSLKDNWLMTTLDAWRELKSIGGDFLLETNNQLENLDELSKLTTIVGTLWFYDGMINTTLVSIAGLSSLQSIGKNVHIQSYNGLSNFVGLEALKTIGGELVLNSNANLSTLEGLTQLQSIGSGLVLGSNVKLTTLDGMNALSSIGTDITIVSQQSLSDISALKNIVSIAGTLKIYSSGLVDLSGLGELTSVGQDVDLNFNGELLSLAGVEKLSTIGRNLVLTRNRKLKSVAGLSAIDSIASGIKVEDNDALTTLAGLGSLTSVRDIVLEDNARLENLAGFENIVSANSVTISVNGIDSYAGISALKTVDRITLSNNDQVTSLSGLSGLTTVTTRFAIMNNDGITSLAGLESLTQASQLVITNNSQLNSISGLSSPLSADVYLNVENNGALADCNVCALHAELTSSPSTIRVESNLSDTCSSPTFPDACP